MYPIRRAYLVPRASLNLARKSLACLGCSLLVQIASNSLKLVFHDSMHPYASFLTRSSTSRSATPSRSGARTPRISTSSAMHHQSTSGTVPVHVKKVSLTSKKNWWLVEMDEQEEEPARYTLSNILPSAEDEYAVAAASPHTTISQPYADVDPGSPSPTQPTSQIYRHSEHRHTERHPGMIFSFPTPTAYSAPPNPTGLLAPVAYGSTSELFKCIVKKPAVVQLEINGEMQSNATDVTTQFLAELRVYTTVTRHRNIVAFLGCLEGVGMVLEHVDGLTLSDVVRARPPLTKEKKIDYHNQLLDGLSHLHSFGLSHGDMSLLNVYVTHDSGSVKLLDFGRSVAADSFFDPPHAAPADPFAYLERSDSQRSSFRERPRVEQIHCGTRPFTAPEVLRGECQDARLADAYSFGVILVCLDQCALVDCDPEEQKLDVVPAQFLQRCDVFRDRIVTYLRRWDQRKRLAKEDMISTRPAWWYED